MAKSISVEGKIEEVKPENGETFSYKELQFFTAEGDENMVEIVPLPSGRSLVGNENAKLIDLPINLKATELWKEEYPIAEYPHNNDQLICGNVLICEASELE